MIKLINLIFEDYDIKSIMHYDGSAFALEDGQYTMLDKRTNKPVKRNYEISSQDFELLNKIYPSRRESCRGLCDDEKRDCDQKISLLFEMLTVKKDRIETLTRENRNNVMQHQDEKRKLNEDVLSLHKHLKEKNDRIETLTRENRTNVMQHQVEKGKLNEDILYLEKQVERLSHANRDNEQRILKLEEQISRLKGSEFLDYELKDANTDTSIS